MSNWNRSEQTDLAEEGAKGRVVVKLHKSHSATGVLPGLERIFSDFSRETKSLTWSPQFVSDYLPLVVLHVPLSDRTWLLDALRSHRGVEYADPIRASLQGLADPDDPGFASDRTPLDWIKVPQTWAKTTGSSGVLIGVIDSGIPLDANGVRLHADLKDEQRFVLGPNLSTNGPPNDRAECGHGTHVTGILAATANNGIGMAGVNWQSPIYICKVFDQEEEVFDDGRFHQAVEATLGYAEARGITRVVINFSCGGLASDLLLETCKLIHDRGAILCAGIGNSGVSLYPAVYASRSDVSILAVGAADRPGGMWPGSAPSASVVALGAAIVSACPPNGYCARSGTSGATPFVSGAASLVWSAHPESSHLDVIARIVQTAVPPTLGPVPDPYSGWGTVDVWKAAL